MRPLLALLLAAVPFVVACSGEEDEATKDGAGLAGEGGQGGGTLAPKLDPTADGACPATAPSSGERCDRADDAPVCSYDATDCQRLNAHCRGKVWTVLVEREECVARPCPPTVPDDGEACAESSIGGSNDCNYPQQFCGDARRAVCDGQAWTVSQGFDRPYCQLRCPDDAPTVGSACNGSSGGCPYTNPCDQPFTLTCSSGIWTEISGRAACYQEECPASLPTPGSSCKDFGRQRSCVYEACGGTYAYCQNDVWALSPSCAE